MHTSEQLTARLSFQKSDLWLFGYCGIGFLLSYCGFGLLWIQYCNIVVKLDF